MTGNETAAGEPAPRRLFVFNGGLLWQKRVRRILSLAGWQVTLGRPGAQDVVGVWGQSPYAYRGEAMAAKSGAGLLRIEDAFLRSLHPGRAGEPPLGLLLDQQGVHFDPSRPSDLETLLATHPLDDTVLLDRARGAIARMIEAHLSKYTAFDTGMDPPAPGYVLVIDQTRDDASVRASRADRNRFLEMLFVAREEHPGSPIVIKTHPESQQGFRPGHFTDSDLGPNTTFCAVPISPWRLFEGAVAVYTVSSGLGFEAILAGHKPRVFGQPFYSGWGLTEDEMPVTRRQRRLTRAQLFAAAMILYPTWYDPYHDRRATLEEAIEALAAQTRAWREDHAGWIASGMRLWKRAPLQGFFGRHTKLRFEEDPARARKTGLRRMVWASKATAFDREAVRVEDGFLRSRGLGAELVPPLSLVTDDLGIYYDPTQPSRLEHLIRLRARLRPDQRTRAEALGRLITDNGLSKYNLDGALPDLPSRPRVLVVGQVEDDASVRLGAGEIKTNADLLRAARQAEPDACLIYKPHPDVEAGLRTGRVDARDLADVVATEADIALLLREVDKLWTMTSLAGFEALLHGVKVTTTGAPFYAGWGLTRDLGPVPPRRREDVSLAGLIHATLIDYPRYVDPRTGLPCPAEVVAQCLVTGEIAHPGLANRLLSKLQGLLASQAHLWRK